jgi:hypothetical protein
MKRMSVKEFQYKGVYNILSRYISGLRNSRIDSSGSILDGDDNQLGNICHCGKCGEERIYYEDIVETNKIHKK